MMSRELKLRIQLFISLCFMAALSPLFADEIHDATVAGDLQRVVELLDAGEDVDVKDNTRVTALYLAAKDGNYKLVELLISHDADVNLSRNDRVTPLHWATRMGNYELAELLILNGAEVEVNNYDGATPLHWACEENNVKIAELLIVHEADVNAKTNDGETPLIIAVDRGREEMSSLLVRSGANVNTICDEYMTPLLFALKKDHSSIAEMLINNGANVNDGDDKSGITPLICAVKNSDDKLTKLLISSGANVKTASYLNFPPLWIAAKNGNLSIVELLIDSGADVNVKDVLYGETPLWFAARDGHEEVVLRLIRAGADVNSAGIFGKTPRKVAHDHDHKKIAEIIKENGGSKKYMKDDLHLYDGPKRKAEELATITGTKHSYDPKDKFTEHSKVHLAGVDWNSCLENNKAKILPGHHVLQVTVTATKNILSHPNRSINNPFINNRVVGFERLVPQYINMEIDVIAGHHYRVDAKIEDGRMFHWVQNMKTGEIVAGKKPSS